jgi:hypothetical protein
MGESKPGGKIDFKSHAFIVASEMASSLVEDKAAMTILTDLFDRHYNKGDWDGLLKMETSRLIDPTITMLGGINEPHFKHFITEKDILGGYIGRNFVIAEYKKNKSNSLIDDLVNPPTPEKLTPHLKQIAALRGPFKSLSKTQPGKLFDEWYHDLDLTVEKNKIEDKTGTLDRVGDSVLKVAMLLSLSDGTSLEITNENMSQAIADCERLIGNIRKTTMGKTGGTEVLAQHKALIIKEVLGRENHMVTRQYLLKNYWMYWNAVQLDEMMDAFDQSGLIKIEMAGSQVVYVMPPDQVEEMMHFLEGKTK